MEGYFSKVLKYPLNFDPDDVVDSVLHLPPDDYHEDRQLIVTTSREKSNSDLLPEDYSRSIDLNYNSWRATDMKSRCLHKKFEGTGLGNLVSCIYETFPLPLGSCRLFRMAPGFTTSFHQDYDVRLVVPLVTNPDSNLFMGLNKVYHLPADGSGYIVDARTPHLAINGSVEQNRPRIHLIFSTHFVDGSSYEESFLSLEKSCREAEFPESFSKIHPLDHQALQRLHNNGPATFEH